MFVEVKTDHIDDKGVIHIDGYRAFDENSEGVGIGYIIHGEIYWRDPEYQFNPLVKVIVEEVLEKQKPFVLNTIDYTKLKSQKQGLLAVLANTKVSATVKEDVQGIVNLIDSIQDFAVDVMGKSESDVFNLTEDLIKLKYIRYYSNRLLIKGFVTSRLQLK